MEQKIPKRPNLLILSDKNSGCMTLCSQDSFETSNAKTNETSKFLVSVRPKILCVSDIFPGPETSYRLLDTCFIESPASQLLSTSAFLLVTLHEEMPEKRSCIRLWSTDDGRCVMSSPRGVSEGKQLVKVVNLDDRLFSGMVLCMTTDGCFQIINVLTMTLQKTIDCGFEAIHHSQVMRGDGIVQLSLIDAAGKIQIWSNSIAKMLIDNEISMKSGEQRRKTAYSKVSFRQCSSLQLEQCNYQDPATSKTLRDKLAQLSFTLKHQAKASPTYRLERKLLGRGEHHQILGFHRKPIEGQQYFVVVFQDRLEVVEGQTQKCILQYEEEKDDGFDFTNPRKKKEEPKWFLFCQFTKVWHQQMLLCVDSEFNLLVFDVDQLLKEDKAIPFMQLNLFNDGKHFNQLEQKRSMLDLEDSLGEQRKIIGRQVEGMVFNFESQQHLLYCFTQGEKGEQNMLTWSLRSLFANLKVHNLGPQKLALHVNPVSLFGSSAPQEPLNSCLSLNPYVTKTYFSRHQHSFFYTEEKVVEQTLYASSEYPSLILGTNFGRIFIVQLFQDTEGGAYPVLVLDAHHQSPITQLYVAYSPSRKVRVPGQSASQAVSFDTGGHLIAGSEDGTISVTDLNSTLLLQPLQSFSVLRAGVDLNRAERVLEERDANLRTRRRQSFSGHQSLQHFFNLVHVRPMQVFDNCSQGAVGKIIEVQMLQNLQTELQKYIQQAVSEPGRAGHKTDGLNDHISSQHVLTQHQRDEAVSRDQGDPQLQQRTPAQIELSQQHQYVQSSPSTFQEINIAETLAQPLQQPIFNELMPFKSSYACLDQESFAAYVLTIDNEKCDLLKMQGLDSAVAGVYEDVLQGIVHVVTERSLNVYSYSKKGKQLLRKSNYLFAMSILQANQTISTLTETQQHFRQAAKLRGDGPESLYDQYSFQQQYTDEQSVKAGRNGGGMSSAGHHRVLDYLSLSLSLPLYYHPHSYLSQKFTKSVKDLLMHTSMLRGQLTQPVSSDNQKKFAQNSIQSLRQLIKAHFVWNERYKADFSQDFYQAQGAVTPLVAGQGSRHGLRQQMVIINTKDMINIFKTRMKALQDSLVQLQKKDNGQADAYLDQNTLQENAPNADAGQPPPDIPAAYFKTSKWPTRLLSLVHPFLLDPSLDENLELFFGLSIPYVDFRIGVQGTDEAFSFIISRDNRERSSKERHDLETQEPCSNEVQLEELIHLLKVSRIKRLQAELKVKQDHSNAVQLSKMAFMNQEYWKTSSYMNTIMSSFFLSTLVSIVEYAQADITTLLCDWLNVVQYITSLNQSPEQAYQGGSEALHKAERLQGLIESIEAQAKPLSVSVISQLMLRKDHSISSCARDMLMKPLMNSGQSIDYIKAEINEWQDLIMDTYLKLKEDSASKHGQTSSVRRDASRPGDGAPSHRGAAESNHSPLGDQGIQAFSTSRATVMVEHPAQQQTINHFFGELEIRGLVNLSQFSLWSMDGPEKYRVDTDVQNRLCKCTVILTREIMTKFTQNSKEHASLLTILMQLLQTQMRAQVPTFQTKVIKEDVIKILLRIYDFYKKQLRDERFLTKVVADNFHLIHPKNSELYLKLTAAKTLLEVGTYFTEDFLKLIHEQATTLREQGPEYQKNVLDVLRYFINSSRDVLDPYLIQIVQTLLKCLDPNDEQLRKNSTQPISIILSIMVKTFSMIAFHHDTQRLAVGTPSGPIAIYDIKTSSRWKILEGHGGKVDCCEFDIKGNLLASYSAADCTLRIWKAGNAGFFSTIMGGTGKTYKEYKLKPIIMGDTQPPASSAQSKAPAPGTVSTRGGRRGSSSTAVAAKCRLKFVNNDKVIELVREDGTTEFHQLSRA